ncbi:MAG: glycosyltransferase family 2 protein [Acidimicrobiia bacterium]|nr:glycosyltransferase family 2 protein [Acidimicrobiia bacterium]
MMDVSVVVCTHLMERKTELEECLASLQQQRRPPKEVIVVVDGNPTLLEHLRARAGPEVVLSTPAPSGLSRARNVGIAHTRATLVAFLDDDAVADPLWLDRLMKVMADPSVAGTSGLSLPLWSGQRPRWFPKELLWTVGCSYAGMPTERAAVRNVFGGCACVRRDLFEALGGFAPELGRNGAGLISCEETEFCMRVLEAHPDVTFVHEPSAVIYHRVPPNRQRLRYVLRRCVSEGQSKALVRYRTKLPVRPLGPERRYLIRTVPLGVLRHLRSALGGDAYGAARAATLLLSVFCAAWSFAASLARLIGSGDLAASAPTALEDRSSGGAACPSLVVEGGPRTESVG